MKIVIIIACTLLGLIFVVFGLNAFFNFIPMPMPKGDRGHIHGNSLQQPFISMATKCFEVVGGLILLSGRFYSARPDVTWSGHREHPVLRHFPRFNRPAAGHYRRRARINSALAKP